MKKKNKERFPALDAAILNAFRDVFKSPEQQQMAIKEAKKAYSFIRRNSEFINQNYYSN